MDLQGETHNWRLLPAGPTEKLNQLSDEARSGDARQTVRRANTILTTPSTLLIGELTRMSSSEVTFHTEPVSEDDETLEQYQEYEAIYDSPYVIGRFIACIALRGVNSGEELGCEVSVETQTGGFLVARMPLEGARIEIDVPLQRQDEILASENERMLGEAFRCLKDCVGTEGEEALLELETLIYGNVDISTDEVKAISLHIRGIGIWSTELLRMGQIVDSQEALNALRFILESSILEEGELYDVNGQTSDTTVEEGMLFAENVFPVQLKSARFVGVNLYSAAFDQLEGGAIHADGTCTPAFQFEDMETSEVIDIQLVRILALLGVSEEDESGSHDDWRQRYEEFVRTQKNRWRRG